MNELPRKIFTAVFKAAGYFKNIQVWKCIFLILYVLAVLLYLKPRPIGYVNHFKAWACASSYTAYPSTLYIKNKLLTYHYPSYNSYNIQISPWIIDVQCSSKFDTAHHRFSRRNVSGINWGNCQRLNLSFESVIRPHGSPPSSLDYKQTDTLERSFVMADSLIIKTVGFNKSDLHFDRYLDVNASHLLNSRITSNCGYYARIIHSTLNGCRMSSTRLILEDVELLEDNVIEFSRAAKLDNIYGPGKLTIVTADTIVLKNLSLERLNLIDTTTVIIVDSVQSIDKRILLNQQLSQFYINNESKKELYQIASEKLIAVREGDVITPWIKENWNYFGFKKGLIIRNSLILLFFFFFCNWIFFPTIISKGYSLTEFQHAEKIAKRRFRKGWRYEIANAFNCLLFTFIVFWGLRLSLEHLKVVYKGYVLLILVQYLFGIVCLAYIANLIITK